MTSLIIKPINFKIDPEYSTLVRPLNSKEDQDLENSLKEHGQKDEIVVDQDGIIIEGHNRYHKLRKLGIPVEKIKYRGKYFEDRLAAKEYILIVNKDRRQSYPFDKVEDAYKLEQIYKERAKLRQLANLNNVKNHISSGPKESNDKDNTSEEKGRVNDIIAKKFGLTPTQYKRGKKILEKGSEEQIKKLRNGQSTITKESNKIQRDEKNQELLDNAKLLTLPQKCDLRYGDFRELCKNIPNNSVSLIITDPPYEDTEENILLYDDLAKLAFRVLKPGGSLVFLVGGIIIDKVIVKVYNSGLTWWWMHGMVHTGSSTAVYSRGIEVKYKSLLGYVKGENKTKPDCLLGLMPDLFKSEPPDKSLHEWAQSQVEVEHFIKYLTVENEIVLDPFLGSGAFGIAALRIGRQFIGCEIDKEAFEKVEANIKNAVSGKNV